MQNKVLDLQPINYYTLKKEICFFIGGGVSNRYYDIVDKFKEELLQVDCITVCRHIKKETQDYFILMTPNYLIYAHRAPENNFQITRIDTGREFQSKKKYMYDEGVFLVIINDGAAVILRNEKYTSCEIKTNSWGMDEETIKDLCDKIDEYFLCDNRHGEYKVSPRFDQMVLQPLKKYTYYEYLAEQVKAYDGISNRINYDYLSFVSGNARKKVYDFISSSFDPDSEQFQIGERVAVETNEDINDELKRRIKGTITDRILDENGVRFQIEFTEQFDDGILIKEKGYILPQLNETQNRVRKNVIRNIENGIVDSKYMYQLFSNFKTDGYEPQDGWEEFKQELMAKKYPPNRSQMEAIQRGIETKDIQLVLGPPGTGKTTVIVSWIEYFISHGKRVLVSSQNNSAVDNVLERIGKNKAARIIRLGNVSKIQENCKKYSIEQQVDGTAEVYIKKIQSSKAAVMEDIESIESKIQFIEAVIDDYKLLCSYRNKAENYKTSFKILQDTILSNYSAAKEAYDKYMTFYENKLHKEIALLAIKRKNRFWRIFYFPISRHIKKELLSINEKVAFNAQNYISYLAKYNQSVDDFVGMIKQPEYVAIKSNIEGLEKKCSGYSLTVKLEGPFTAPVLDSSDERGENCDSYERIIHYVELLKNTKEKLVKVSKTLDDWAICINNKRNEIVANILIQNSNVVGATCIGINTRRQIQNLNFDVSIIDESGQIQIHNAIVPMSRAPKTLMLGDHLQIPPMVDEKVKELCKNDGIKTDLLEMSFFEFIFKKLEEKNPKSLNLTRLDEQFRMPGVISDVISDWFYNGNYHAHYDMSKWEPIISGTKSPLILISTSKESDRFEQDAEASQDKSPGYSNELEADIVAKIVAKVFREREDLDNEKIGVISAYGKQVRLIRQKISDAGLGFSSEQIYGIAASLDSFQGQERPLIIYSSTRSTSYKKPNQARVGFMKELRRLNVAFTRCQKQLVIIGDFDYLTSCEYEEIDEETGNPVPNRSEKQYAEFMQKMVDQAKGENGEFYYLNEFYQKVGIDL